MERVGRVGIGDLKGRPEGGSVLTPVVGEEIFGKGGSVQGPYSIGYAQFGHSSKKIFQNRIELL